MAVLGFNFSLIDQLAFYGSYHRNKWNQIIHFFFVPLILWSFAVWIAGLTGPLQLPYSLDEQLEAKLGQCFVPTGASVVTLVYFTYYLILEPFAGATWGLFVGLPLSVTANFFWQVPIRLRPGLPA